MFRVTALPLANFLRERLFQPSMVLPGFMKLLRCPIHTFLYMQICTSSIVSWVKEPPECPIYFQVLNYYLEIPRSAVTPVKCNLPDIIIRFQRTVRCYL